MERDEFLKSLGIGLALVCTGTCFQACSKGGEDEAAPNNTNNSGNTVNADTGTLANIGSKTVIDGVLFMRIGAGNTESAFIASEPFCTHQGGQLNFVQGENKIRCSTHGAEFSTSGAVLLGPAARALKMYAVKLNGTTLTATKS